MVLSPGPGLNPGDLRDRDRDPDNVLGQPPILGLTYMYLSISNLHVDIISFHVSYRMGIFGFVTDTETIRPNLGFLDQEMALNWIWDNIENLGGRKDKIVLAGQGFGGVSVLHHFEKFQPARKDS